MIKKITWPLLTGVALMLTSVFVGAQTNWNGTWTGNFIGTLTTPCSTMVPVDEPQQFVFVVSNGVVSGSGTSSGFLCYNSDCTLVDSDNYAGPISGTTTSNTISFTYSFTVLDGSCATVVSNVVVNGTNNGTNITGNWNISGTFTLTNESTPPAGQQIAVFDGAEILTNGQIAGFKLGAFRRGQVSTNLGFTIINTGSQPLALSSVSVPPGFLIQSNFPDSLGAGSNGTFTVQLDTSAVGDYSGNIVISNNDPTNGVFSIPISGSVTGAVIALGGDLAFGSVRVGTNAQSTLTISNTGNQTLVVSNIVSPSVFALSASNGSIAAGSNLAITVTFAPTSVGFFSGTIGVVSDASQGGSQIAESGIGANNTLVLTVDTSGSGKVTPPLSGKTLVAGKKYTLTATAGAGYLFSGWTGSVVSSGNPLTFVMEVGTVLEANFVPNPFLTIKGSFDGLFSSIDGVTEETAGMLKGLTIGSKGTYSGSLLVNGAAHGLSGKFTPAGTATETIARSAAQGGPLTLSLTLTNSTSGALQLTGMVSNANWQASVLADIGTNTVPTGRYTLLIPPDTNNGAPPNAPLGDGYALIANVAGNNPAVARAGISGVLADGTSFSETVPVSTDGYIPIYVSLYANKGLLTGWISLVATNTNGVGLTWIRPIRPGAFYPAGFSSAIASRQLQISPWTGTSAGFDTLAMLSLPGSSLPVTISSKGKIKGTGVSGNVNTTTGAWSVTVGTGPAKINGFGAIVPNASLGGGYFLTKTNSQLLELQP